jgi:hypothetical protein
VEWAKGPKERSGSNCIRWRFQRDEQGKVSSKGGREGGREEGRHIGRNKREEDWERKKPSSLPPSLPPSGENGPCDRAALDGK